MIGKVCMVTGANKGMGKVAALELAKRGATVIMICRNARLGREAQEEIKKLSGNSSVELFIADLSSLKSVRRLAQEFLAKHDKLHVLFNNAGGVFSGKQASTEDGFEMNLGVNHLGSFLLINLLLEPLIASGSGRIVNTASMVMSKALSLDNYKGEQPASPMKMYGQSKLAVVMSGYALVRRLEGTGVTVNSLHPGFVRTDNSTNSFPKLLRPLMGLFKSFILTPEQGAQTALYLATSSEVEGVTGKYYVKKTQKSSVPVSYDEAQQERVWKYSAELTGLE
jgi:NAD(P)-dependent dehydrogenase (short-subunit alcohol dehydrogenase family)